MQQIQQSVLLKEQNGEEAASRATSRAQRVSGSFHPIISFRKLPSTAGSAASIWPSQELSRFAESTLRYFVLPRNTKEARHCAEAVDDATSLWKPEEI